MAWVTRAKCQGGQGQNSLPGARWPFPAHAGPRMQSEPAVQAGGRAGTLGAPVSCQQEQGLGRKVGQCLCSVLVRIPGFHPRQCEGAKEPELFLQPHPHPCSLRSVKALRSLPCVEANITSPQCFISDLSPPFALQTISFSSFSLMYCFPILVNNHL